MGFLLCLRVQFSDSQEHWQYLLEERVQGELLKCRCESLYTGSDCLAWIRPDCPDPELALRDQAEALGVGWQICGEGAATSAIWDVAFGQEFIWPGALFANLEISGQPEIPEAGEAELELP